MRSARNLRPSPVFLEPPIPAGHFSPTWLAPPTHYQAEESPSPPLPQKMRAQTLLSLTTTLPDPSLMWPLQPQLHPKLKHLALWHQLAQFRHQVGPPPRLLTLLWRQIPVLTLSYPSLCMTYWADCTRRPEW